MILKFSFTDIDNYLFENQSKLDLYAKLLSFITTENDVVFYNTIFGSFKDDNNGNYGQKPDSDSSELKAKA